MNSSTVERVTHTPHTQHSHVRGEGGIILLPHHTPSLPLVTTVVVCQRHVCVKRVVCCLICVTNPGIGGESYVCVKVVVCCLLCVSNS